MGILSSTTIKTLLSDKGILWLTVPTNAPAIDHVYLFKNKEEIYDMIESSGLAIIDKFLFSVENTDTQLIGVYCKNEILRD